eukprot:TRINITY_DN58242_c0_g1_i1.p2 TRINITY_DN58242_c0_g1~~TRINITY_DN58242_c0_g1_i1.p2  ORF type:complete len:155 (-),score=34.98 TRINITY_DN58242_c0_g1_i1:103-567(-)
MAAAPGGEKLNELFRDFRAKKRFRAIAPLEGFITSQEHHVYPGTGHQVRFDTTVVFPPLSGGSAFGTPHHMLLRVKGEALKSRIGSRSLQVSCRLGDGRVFLLLTQPSADMKVDQLELEAIADYAREHLDYPEAEPDTILCAVQEMLNQFAVMP